MATNLIAGMSTKKSPLPSRSLPFPTGEALKLNTRKYSGQF